MKERIHKILGIATTASIILAGICLMLACLGLYRDDQFSPQGVADAFRPIAVPIYLCLGLIAVSLIFQLFLPRVAEKAPCKKAVRRPTKQKLSPVTLAVLILAAVCLVAGYFTGGTVDVLTKAANICTECVGLG